MKTIFLALLWHQHQPYYRDPLTDTCAMPWVRMHGTKDYFGMAALAEEFPEVRVNINLVPSLIEQLRAYVDRGADDIFLRHARIPAADLTPDDKRFLLRNFFFANHDHMIRPSPRYGGLMARVRTRDGLETALATWNAQDYRDLQVWQNLAWFHPIARERDPAIAELVRKDRAFSEDDKALCLDRQHELLKAVLPMHRKLQDEGRIEISTTPMYHPILPLLCRMGSARVAMPQCALPRMSEELTADARWHLEQGVRTYRREFACDPRGCWPSEGSVSPEILPLLREAGFTWFASDEEVLLLSDGGAPNRHGPLRQRTAEILYRPYSCAAGSGSIAGLFRDHRLSDMIGFDYQRYSPTAAAQDLVGRIREAGRSAPQGIPLVTLILDGENAWEHYPNNGIQFLRHLYQLLSKDPEIRMVRISDFLEAHPPEHAISRLHSGSWISHNFSIWVGHPEDNAAWEAVDRARQVVVAAARDPATSPEALERAWGAIHIAEGSDWYWWFGDDHASALDAEFDAMFRRHVANAYVALGKPVPPSLSEPIKRGRTREMFTAPWAFLRVEVDGRRSDYYEWIASGVYQVRREATVMDQGASSGLSELHFGFSMDTLYLRADALPSWREWARPGLKCGFTFLVPHERRLVIEMQEGKWTASVYNDEEASSPRTDLKVAADEILEVACPFSVLGAKTGDRIEFVFTVESPGEVPRRYPVTVPLACTVPAADFEEVDWSV